MPRIPAYPLAEHPLDQLPGSPECSLPVSNRTYLTIVMLENSLRLTKPYIKGRLLDVGCGQRPYEKTFFAGASEYIGCDYLSDRSRPDVICSALDLTFPDNAFDTVVSTEVLEHVPDPQLAFREMFRVVKPGGYVIVSTPLYWPRHEVPYDFFRYPYDGLLHIVKESGLEVEKLYNRGRSYAFLGQVVEHMHPVRAGFVHWLINRFFLWCDRNLNHDALTLGWTVIARKPVKPASGT
ncbi:MAG: class I SAM-dependent methyltransferase [Akkermansiaceae bacterium]|nr:class I SAM-dependent methyltransferase [Verrucomicrobiales bacterium]